MPKKNALINKFTGRPTTLTNKIAKQIQQYFEDFQETIDEHIEEKQDKSGATTTKYKKKPNGIPSLLKLADSLKLSRNQVYGWYNKDVKFRMYFDEMKRSLSSDIVIENGLNGSFSHNFAKSYLENTGIWNKEKDLNDTKPVNIVFKEQINYFLAQQGVKPIKIGNNEPLPAFSEPEVLDAEIVDSKDKTGD